MRFWISRALVLLFLAIFLIAVRGWGQQEANTHSVNCDSGGTISGALGRLRPGDTMIVSGNCSENVLIPAEVQRIVLDGQAKTTLHGPDSSRAPITIVGRGITVRGFRITGGRNGINVLRGGTALIDGNTIQNTGAGRGPGSGDGINIAQHSYAQVINTTIQNNPGYGVAVHESSSARIGFTDVDNPTARQNIVRGNGKDGVFVFDASNALIVGNTISENGGNGVHIAQVAHAVVAGNEINGNRGSGIVVRQNSGATILNPGSSAMGGPNQTSQTAKNAEFGIQCSTGGYAEGSLGTLSGRKGAVQFEKSCVNRLTK